MQAQLPAQTDLCRSSPDQTGWLSTTTCFSLFCWNTFVVFSSLSCVKQDGRGQLGAWRMLW